MIMTNEEIVREYRQARSPKKQIKILADENEVTPSEIRAVLAAAGVEDVKAPQRVRRKKTVPPDEGPEQPTEETVELPRVLGPVELSFSCDGIAISVTAPDLAGARQASDYLQRIISDLEGTLP